jgi:hypothetical protein
MKDDLEHRAEIAVPVTSRRKLIRTAAVTGGAGLLSAGLVLISAQEGVKKATQFVPPVATKDITRFNVHVPQAALDDLKKRLAAAAGPTEDRQRTGPRAYRWRKRMRSLNTGALATIGAVLSAH